MPDFKAWHFFTYFFVPSTSGRCTVHPWSRSSFVKPPSSKQSITRYLCAASIQSSAVSWHSDKALIAWEQDRYVQRGSSDTLKLMNTLIHHLYCNSMNKVSWNFLINLKYFLLLDSHPGDSGIQHLVSALPTLPSLAVLDLASNGITNKGLSFVAGALTSKESLSSGPQQVWKWLPKRGDMSLASVLPCLESSDPHFLQFWQLYPFSPCHYFKTSWSLHCEWSTLSYLNFLREH